MANVEFKCPNCGAPLSFDSSSQKVACPYCEAEFDVDDISILKDAFKDAYSNSLENDVILLSPASASWDQYKECEVRGAEFKDLVKKLKESKN